MAAGQATGYSGPDRRQPVTYVDSRPYLARVASAGLALLAVWCLLVVLAGSHGEPARLALVSLAQALACALFLAAAALRLAAWRITGTSRAAWHVIVLAVAGFAIPVVGLVSAANQGTPGGIDAASVARGLVQLGLVCFGTMALLSPAVVSRLRPLRIVAPFLAGCLVIAGIIVIRGPAGQAAPALAATADGLRWTVAVLWAALAVAYVLAGRRRHRRSDVITGIGLMIPAAGSLTRAMLGALPYSRMAVPAGVQLFLACVLAGASAIALWQLQTGRGTRLLAVAGELRGARTDLAQVEHDQARRLHDARSTILAISGATRMLARPESSNGIAPEQLQQLVAAELDRLGTLLDPGYRSATRAFRPAEVIEPLALAHRLTGTPITTDLGDCRAVGRPEDTATAVANLLSNARAHAPGAHVWIDVHDDGDDVLIRIADDGPGIPASEREFVLADGVRGSGATAPGSGIGLAAAAKAMSDQGGTLRIGERPGGGTMIILTLRRDRRRPPPDAPSAAQRSATTTPATSVPAQRQPAPASEPRAHLASERTGVARHGRIGAVR